MFKIAIDGYMGSGKSTLAEGLVRRLGESFKKLDTGAIFRAFAYAYSKKYGKEIEEKNCLKLFEDCKFDIRFIDGKQNMFINNENVTPFLRTEEMSAIASKISTLPLVREKYLEIAKDFSNRHNCVIEGRDIGSVLMPDANIKIFLTAEEGLRAKRRYDEAILRGEKVTLAEVLKDLRERDERDSTRAVAPLKPTYDSIIVDNSDMTLEETIDFCYDIVMKTMKKKFVSVAIDGYVCSGKSTIAKELARRLGYRVFDTGAVYRGIACAFRYLHGDENAINEKMIDTFSKQIYVDVKFINGLQHVLVNGIDHTKELRSEEISVLSAKISPYTSIREKVLKIQRKFAENNNTVMEGRDIGSEVLPNADFKFFITADENVRAKRRFDQQKFRGDTEISFEKVLEDLRDRDYKDTHREHGAIKKMPDAYVIDTTNKTIDDSVDECLEIMKDASR